MEVSGNMATVTTKYSQPTGRPNGFEIDPEFKVNGLVPVSGVRKSTCSSLLGGSSATKVAGGGFTVCRSMCTICPMM